LRSDLGSKCTESADSDGRRDAGKVGGNAPDLLVTFVCRISADEFVVLENDDDVRSGIDGWDVKTAGRDELYVDLAL
jgi:hypothetical protein